MASEESKARAASLKAEGNALHSSKQYKEAYAKYSEAIEADGTNAVLYANRAASCMEMREYLNAACDANKATGLDPNYLKAWSRLAKACDNLCVYEQSVHAWAKALALCTPQDGTNPNKDQLELKKICAEGLEKAKAAQKARVTTVQQGKHMTAIPQTVQDGQNLPWQRAKKMEPDMNKIGPSSAWVILHAYREFSEGVEAMKQTTEKNGMIMGPTKAIECISNGILRDPRVFHLDCPDWFVLFARQMKMEMVSAGAWTGAGPIEVQAQALKMQQEKGWNVVRRALSVTIRAWVLRGFIEEKTQKNPRNAVEFYRNALTVLEWGTRTWSNVSNEDRGAIFSPTLIRGIRRLYIESYLAAYKEHGAKHGFTREELDRLAEELIQETKANMPTGREEWLQEGGFFASFFLYPLAEAHATRGLVFMEKGLEVKDTDSELADDYFAEAADQYITAAKTFPPDEERRLYYLKVAFEAVWYKSAPLGEALALCQIVHKSEPAVWRIWEYGPYMQERVVNDIGLMYSFEEKAYVGLIEGRFTLESPSTVVDIFKC